MEKFIIYRLAVVSLVLLLTQCTAIDQPLSQPLQTKATGCNPDAVQLLQPIAIYRQPAAETKPDIELATGRFVYLCDEQSGWVSVMYPQSGDAINCHYRNGENRCRIGWTKLPLKYRLFD